MITLLLLAFFIFASYVNWLHPILGIGISFIIIIFVAISRFTDFLKLFKQTKYLQKKPVSAMISFSLLCFLAGLSFLYFVQYPLRDLSTDSNSPPQFKNALYSIPVSSGREYLGPEFQIVRSFSGNAQVQMKNYFPLNSIILQVPPSETFILLKQALENEAGLKITAENKQSPHLEAEAFLGFLPFKQDIIIEARPIPNQLNSSKIDIRARSRDIASDLSFCARRIISITSFLKMNALTWENTWKAKIPK